MNNIAHKYRAKKEQDNEARGGNHDSPLHIDHAIPNGQPNPSGPVKN
jgi:hypothetical protein